MKIKNGPGRDGDPGFDLSLRYDRSILVLIIWQKLSNPLLERWLKTSIESGFEGFFLLLKWENFLENIFLNLAFISKWA